MANRLPVPRPVPVRPVYSHTGLPPASPVRRTGGLLVPIGGGKDSMVLIDAVKHLRPRLFAVNPHPLVRRSGRPDRPRPGGGPADGSIPDWGSSTRRGPSTATYPSPPSSRSSPWSGASSTATTPWPWPSSARPARRRCWSTASRSITSTRRASTSSASFGGSSRPPSIRPWSTHPPSGPIRSWPSAAPSPD